MHLVPHPARPRPGEPRPPAARAVRHAPATRRAAQAVAHVPGVLTPTSQMRTLRELEEPSHDEGFAAIEVVHSISTRPAGLAAGVLVAAAALRSDGWETAVQRAAPASAPPDLRLESRRRARTARARRATARGGHHGLGAGGAVSARGGASGVLVPAAAARAGARVRPGPRARSVASWPSSAAGRRIGRSLTRSRPSTSPCDVRGRSLARGHEPPRVTAVP